MQIIKNLTEFGSIISVKLILTYLKLHSITCITSQLQEGEDRFVKLFYFIAEKRCHHLTW